LDVAALHTVDAGGNDLGLLVSLTSNEYTVMLSSGNIVSIRVSETPPELKVGGVSFVGWSAPGCVGTAYVEESLVTTQGLLQGLFYVDADANNFYRIPVGATAAPVTFASRRESPAAPCGPAPSSATSAFVLEPVDVPFTVPLTKPLHVRATL
jgi:hypothetical protein